MKYPFRFIIVANIAVLLLSNMSSAARADETNEVTPPPKVEKKVFIFNGGNPIDFILAMDRHFRTRLEQILSIPSSLVRAHVPKMKISTEKPKDALEVYNHLEDPTLGQWRYGESSSVDPWDPSVLTLVPDKQVASSKSGARVKALSLRGLVLEKDLDRLIKDVEAARAAGRKEADLLGGDRYEGSIKIQMESNILIAAGSEAFIEMVESVVAAHRDNSMLSR